MSSKPTPRRRTSASRDPTAITICAAMLAAFAATPALAQDAQLIQNLRNNIAIAEQTRLREPYLAAACPQLMDGQHFLHRGLRARGGKAIWSLAEWQAAVNQLVANRQITAERGAAAIQRAKARASEVQNACRVDETRQQLASALQPRLPSTMAATFTWNRTGEANQVINSKGLLTGSLQNWQYTGQDQPSWAGGAIVNATCTGRLDPGRRADPQAPGEMTCRANWTQNGKNHQWQCTGNGKQRWDTSMGWHWFLIWPGSCVGTATDAQGRPVANTFGTTSIVSKLGM